MATTLGTARTELRTRLGESSANEWSDATLLSYISRAEVWLANLIGRIPNSGRLKYQETKTLSANATTIAYSTLTKRFAGISAIYMVLPGDGLWTPPLTRIDPGQSWAFRGPTLSTVAGLAVPGYYLQDENFVFYPPSTQARDMVINYRYLPASGKSSSGDLETPDDYIDALITRAAHFALADAGETNASFENEYASLVGEIEEYEIMRSSEGMGESIKRQSSITLT
jgi:hypothetical protein